MEILKFPIEIMECIVNHIDEPSNLISLALTTKLLSLIIIPDHIQLRWIHTHLGRTKVWQNIINKPHLATRVRKLRIEHPGTLIRYITPPQFTQNVTEEPSSASTISCFGKLLDALRFMDLSSIYFKIDEGEPDRCTFLILKTLTQANGALEELEFTWTISMGSQHDFTQILPLHLLRRLSVTIESPFKDLSEDALKRFCSFLKLNCRSIVELRLVFDLSTTAVWFIWNSLRQTEWPKLRIISVQQVFLLRRLYPQGFTEFLDRNSHITNILTQGIEFPLSSHYRPKWLGEIQSLTFELHHDSSDYRIPIHPCLSRILHPQTLSSIRHFNTKVSQECLSMVRQMTSLRSCVGHLQFPLQPGVFLASLPPGIQCIEVFPAQTGRYQFPMSHSQSQTEAEHTSRLLQEISKKRNLVYLGGFFVDLPGTRKLFSSRIVPVLLRHPTLRCIGFDNPGLGGRGDCLELDSVRNAATYDNCFIHRDPQEYLIWGEHFLGNSLFPSNGP